MKVDDNNKVFVVSDIMYGTLRQKFFFEYTFSEDADGFVYIHKKVLNPEAALRFCE